MFGKIYTRLCMSVLDTLPILFCRIHRIFKQTRKCRYMVYDVKLSNSIIADTKDGYLRTSYFPSTSEGDTLS